MPNHNQYVRAVPGAAVKRLHKKLLRPVTSQEIAEELGWKTKALYKHLKKAVKDHLIEHDHRTRERNVKGYLPLDGGSVRFLPSPRSVLRHYPQLGRKVKYIDPLSGKWKAVRR